MMILDFFFKSMLVYMRDQSENSVIGSIRLLGMAFGFYSNAVVIWLAHFIAPGFFLNHMTVKIFLLLFGLTYLIVGRLEVRFLDKRPDNATIISGQILCRLILYISGFIIYVGAPIIYLLSYKFIRIE